jgi:alcohol dehydrogenase (cytochrome c)
MMALSNKGRRWPHLLSVAGNRRARRDHGARAGGNQLCGQAQLGTTVYTQNCAACHGSDLTNGEFAPPLKGPGFLAKWGRPATHRAARVHAQLDAADQSRRPARRQLCRAGRLHPPRKRRRAGRSRDVPGRPSGARARREAVGGLSTRVHPLGPAPSIPDRFANFTPVTEAELANPAPEDWPAWRRSHAGLGYSPLDQIDTANVGRLTIAWAQALPPGVNMNEPLVRDGVLYVFGFGDQVFAFDAASGRQLWRYQRRVAQGTQLNSRKTIALYGDKLYTATSDNHMVALDARTGRPVWDVALTDRLNMRIPGGRSRRTGCSCRASLRRQPAAA